MSFDPNNRIVQLCLQGMQLEEKNESVKARSVFLQAWHEASNEAEKFIAAFFVARQQKEPAGKLHWLQTTIQLALQINDDSVTAAFPLLYEDIARTYEAINDPVNAEKNYELSRSSVKQPTDPGPFYHGTKADLKVGDFLTPGFQSNYQSELKMNHIYFTALPNGAGLAAALANGEGRERVYIVEPTGSFEDDPNVTNKKFPGNPTRSYRTAAPLKIVGELMDWTKQSPEEIKKWREKLANNKGEIIN